MVWIILLLLSQFLYWETQQCCASFQNSRIIFKFPTFFYFFPLHREIVICIPFWTCQFPFYSLWLGMYAKWLPIETQTLDKPEKSKILRNLWFTRIFWRQNLAKSRNLKILCSWVPLKFLRFLDFRRPKYLMSKIGNFSNNEKMGKCWKFGNVKKISKNLRCVTSLAFEINLGNFLVNWKQDSKTSVPTKSKWEIWISKTGKFRVVYSLTRVSINSSQQQPMRVETCLR